jgi:hypothetical protein
MAEQKGKGGIKHQILQKKIADHFRKQGNFAEIEAYIGKNIDVLVIDNDKTIGIEVQLSAKHCIQVIEDFKLGCDEVWIVYRSQKVLEEIKNILMKSLLITEYQKIRFCHQSEFKP